MPVVPFAELMARAQQGAYAVGYFESWNLGSLEAVAHAAEATRSPVILGFGGLNWPGAECPTKDHMSVYANMGLAACRNLTVPACLIFNESPHLDWVLSAVELGFGIVMFADDTLGLDEQAVRIRQVVDKAHTVSVAVEGEMSAPPGLDADLSAAPDDRHCTDPDTAVAFVQRTGVDALAVNIGQVHLHGRINVDLDFARLQRLRDAVSVPLVLHGASSIRHDELVEAIRRGVRKINVGSVLKRTYFETLRAACAAIGDEYNPYEVVGSGCASDVLGAARAALQEKVEELLRLFGSAGKA